MGLQESLRGLTSKMGNHSQCVSFGVLDVKHFGNHCSKPHVLLFTHRQTLRVLLSLVWCAMSYLPAEVYLFVGSFPEFLFAEVKSRTQPSEQRLRIYSHGLLLFKAG